jgi:hypothetical protein
MKKNRQITNFKKSTINGFKSLLDYLISSNLVSGSINAFFIQSLPETRIQKIEEFFKFLNNNQALFTKQILNNSDFKDVFILTIEKYIRLRYEKKRKIMQNIFLDFIRITDEEKKVFQVERFYDTLDKISLEAIEYLKFVIEILQEKVINDIKKANSDNKYLDNDLGCLKYCANRNGKFVTTYLTQHIDENYHPNSKKVQEQYNYNSHANDEQSKKLLDFIFGKESEQIIKMNEMIAEYISLGLFRTEVRGGGSLGGGGGHSEATITDYGIEFIKFIKNTDSIIC